MNTFILLCAVVSAASASVIGLGGTIIGPGELGAVLKGPAAEATIKGPDGGLIAASAQAGALTAAGRPGGVITAAVSPGLVAAPIGIAKAPLAIATPVIASSGLAEAAVLKGPSGIVSNIGLGGPIIGDGVLGGSGLGLGLGLGLGGKLI